MQRPARFILPGWVALIFLALCGGGGFVSILIKSSSAPPIPALGDPISLRGDRVAILRLPTAPIQEIAVYADGHANRYAYPIIPNAYAQIQFSPAEQQEFEQLRTAWCQAIPPLRTVALNEPFYDLAFRCGGDDGKQAKVPVDMLPIFFAHVLQRLPANSS